MPVFENIFRLFHSKRIKEIEKHFTEPEKLQENILTQLLCKAKNTHYGQQHNFKAIRNIEMFQKQVPIITYEDFYPWIEQSRRGQNNIIWPQKIRWFAKSSGTTNDKSKFIPVSPDALSTCHYKGANDVLVFYLTLNTKSKLFSGKTFTLGGSHHVDKYQHHIRSGDLSAIMLQNIPVVANFFRTPPKDIVLIPDWEEKTKKMLPIVSKENVTAFAGVPSWNLVFINKLLEYCNKKSLLDIWPNLELFMHGGINFGPYRDQFQRLIPSDSMHYIETYNASEGFFAIQNDFLDDAMLLMLDYGIFYEFIEIHDFQNNNFKAVPLSEVKIGVNYAMVITTNSGLWRYVIGDTVKFTSTKPYKVIISGRTKHYLNAFGEELMVHNADKAIETAAHITEAIINEYTVAPQYLRTNSAGRHEWIIEFEKLPNDMNNFTKILDNTLKEINSDYEAKRYKDITLQAPIIHVAPKGTFYRWFEAKNKLGGQNKIPRLSNERKYIDELLLILEGK